jgi:hypothetical protein
MGFKGLKIKNHITGEPRQPVPLRLLPFIISMNSDMGLSLIGAQFDTNNGTFKKGTKRYKYYYLLTAYQYNGDNNPSRLSHPEAEELYKRVLQHKSHVVKIKEIPSNLYVWSDEIPDALTSFLGLTIGIEEAGDNYVDLNWNPATPSCKSLIDECPDFKAITLKIPTVSKRLLIDRNLEILENAKDLRNRKPVPIPQHNIATTIEHSNLFTSGNVNNNPLTRRHIKKILNDLGFYKEM